MSHLCRLEWRKRGAPRESDWGVGGVGWVGLGEDDDQGGWGWRVDGDRVSKPLLLAAAGAAAAAADDDDCC